MIFEFADSTEDALVEDGLEGLVQEIVTHIEPTIRLPMLSQEQKHTVLELIVRCVVAYSLPGAAATLLGEQAADVSIMTAKSTINTTAALLTPEKRIAVVSNVESNLPELTFVDRSVQHRIIVWGVDTVGSLLEAAVPTELATALVGFSDEELARLQKQLCEVAVNSATPLDLLMDKDTKTIVVYTVMGSVFSVLYDVSDGDVSAERRLEIVLENETELNRKLAVFRYSSHRKERRLVSQLEATEKQKLAIWREHPNLNSGPGPWPGPLALALAATAGGAAALAWVSNTETGK